MGGVLGIVLIALVGSALIAGVVMSSVALYRLDHPISGGIGGGGSGSGDVTLTGSQTLSNKTLVAPVVSRLATNGGTPSVAASGNGAVFMVAPTMSSDSTDMAGIVLSNGTGVQPPSGSTFTLTITFSTPYSLKPASVLIFPTLARLWEYGPADITWTTDYLRLHYSQFNQTSLPDQGGIVPFCSYMVIAAV